MKSYSDTLPININTLVEAIVSKSDVVLQAPLPLPRRNLMCIGKNYLDHVKEVKAATSATVGRSDGISS